MATTDNLARFERLAQRAAARRKVQEEAERRAAAERWEEDYGAPAEARSKRSPEYLAGPPNGCHDCYVWRRHIMGGWCWEHQAAIDPVTKALPWGGYESEPCEHCTHKCHGPEGEPLPVIAYAGA